MPFMACIYIKVMVTVFVGFIDKARIVYLGEEIAETKTRTPKDVSWVRVLIKNGFLYIEN
jgi:hypothetical protein